MLKRIYPEAGPRKSFGVYNHWMHAPEDRGDVPDDLLLMMEKEATNSDLVQDYRWMYSIALLRTPVGRVGEDLQEEVVDVFIAILGHHI